MMIHISYGVSLSRPCHCVAVYLPFYVLLCTEDRVPQYLLYVLEFVYVGSVGYGLPLPGVINSTYTDPDF